jgi:alkane 1-monooxygenase
MEKRELKYLLAYPLSLLPLVGLAFHGYFTWATVLVAFGLLPFIELFNSGTTANLTEEDEQEERVRPIFDWLLYLNVPILWATLLVYFWQVSNIHLATWELIGITLSVGIICGTLGINVAHELGHRKKKSERLMAQTLLLGSLYQHFFIEHNRGHHRWVATPHDPATARKGEWLYAFWFRSMAGGFVNAWKLENKRLQGQWLSWNNLMLRFFLLEIATIVSVGLIFSWSAALAFLVVALIGGLLLESVNYLEHYGIQRRMIRPGVYEPVSPKHSWNSDHPAGRIVLYELTRHADHHYRASRKYQILRHVDRSPQLPTNAFAPITTSG